MCPPAIGALRTRRLPANPFLIGNGFNLWDITHVDNAADAHVLAIEKLLSSRTAAGEAFFIQNNEPIVFRNFCLAIWAHFWHVPPFEMHIPKSLAYFAGLACETVTWLMGTTTTLSRGSVQDACAIRHASGNKAKEILGYEARIGIEEAIRLSCEVHRRDITKTTFFVAVITKAIQDYASRLGVKLPRSTITCHVDGESHRISRSLANV
ncbi:hypothetical protein N7463_004136 [Penicillium fimorum]|uniref:3-beta hydroxysteroid dehydrogenase/isomerase domain-containing protein n=1 Tax=Penicillium fimorum TaxID=1882269 RepID=A0A9W9Y2B3_9EURO|nr:hypothetical protein N7463_004136 [Penicillium fimorum]